MRHNKVSHDAGGQYWGAPQVIRLREECTGTPTMSIYPYPTKNVIRGHRQYNTLAHCRVQLAKQRYSNVTKTHVKTIDLFGIQSSQESSHDDPPSPPPPSPPHRPRRRARHSSTPPRLAPRRSIVSEAGERSHAPLSQPGSYVSARACQSGITNGPVQGGCSVRASPICLEMSTTVPAVVSQRLCL